MSDIFIKTYLDEDVNVLVADYIRLQTFTALTTTEAGKKGKSDAEQLKFATENGYAILTHNRKDYEKLAQVYFANSQTHCGIIISVRRTPQEIAQLILDVLNDFTADEIKNQIIYI